MKVSQFTIDFLGTAIAGDSEGFPYRSGPQLVKFFNEHGSRDVYPMGGGFPTRRIYARQKVRELNDTPALDAIVCSLVDPRPYLQSDLPVENAVEAVNKNLEYDGYELVKEGHFYKLRSTQSGRVSVNPAVGSSNVKTQAAVDEQIRKCESKLSEGDFSGAITNARALVETVFTAIEDELAPGTAIHDGDLLKQYGRIQKLLNLSPGRADIDSSLKQVLQGLTSVVNGLASVRNKMSDAHAATVTAKKHHAQLVVESAVTLVNFLVDSKAYQQKRGSIAPTPESTD